MMATDITAGETEGQRVVIVDEGAMEKETMVQVTNGATISPPVPSQAASPNTILTPHKTEAATPTHETPTPRGNDSPINAANTDSDTATSDTQPTGNHPRKTVELSNNAPESLQVEPLRLPSSKGVAPPPSTIPPLTTNESAVRTLVKQVRFSDEKSVAPSFFLSKRLQSNGLSLTRRFQLRKVVVALTPPTDDEALRAELAVQLPSSPPEIGFQDHMWLGVRWSKQVKLLRSNCLKSPETLTMRRVKLPSWKLVATLGVAYNMTLVTLDVEGAGLDVACAKVLFQVCRTNRSILQLNAAHNAVGDDAVYALAAMVHTNTSLTQLILHHNAITSKGMKVLSHALQDNQDSMIFGLDLSFNPLGEGSTDALSACLQVNESLTSLNLAGCCVHEAGLLASLRRNYTLTALHLQSEDVSEQNQSGRLRRDRLNRSHAPPIMDALRRSTCALETCNLTGVQLPVGKIRASRWVKMAHTRLNELDGMILSALLPMNKVLMELDLSSNALRSESVLAIVTAIVDCPTLERVDVHDNDVSDVVGEALGLALVHNNTLQTICVATSHLDVQQLRGNSDTADEITYAKDQFTHPLDNWIVTVLFGVNRRTTILNELHVPPDSASLDMCHLTLAVYEAVYICTRIRHHVRLANLLINSSNLTYYAGMRLADALRNHPILLSVSLEHNNLHQLGGKAIAECMEHNRSITLLNLSWNNLDDVGVLPFATSLRANRCLKRLDLRGNAIGATGIAAISTGLAGNACLEELYLRWNDIGTNAARALAAALCINKTLAVLDIERHHMETDGAVAMAGMLRVNKSLTSLNMKGDLMVYPGSSVGVVGAEQLALALGESNHSLRYLVLAESKIHAEGCEHLAKIVATSRLTVLDLSYAEMDGETSLVLFSQLAHNTALVELHLAHNTVGADGIKGCVRSLCVNKSLRHLDLSFNHVTEEGMLLVEAQAKNFSLLRLNVLGNRVTDGTRGRLMAMSLFVVEI
ncbi:hypothetical protein H257_05848 [Aphanomyces astaci]|uniref:Uncharacterized protein n=1 Tax=Aphanomyces astaci TaxID=112090 RepID=W4GPM9_APHAT|nr:hypothetical protein H257_05848 [Aphanomyces astaci]ETV81286.1 hypothetical protein H257_05848 [Aphanomyces astaci]|eukprot:XP_009829144.1 hypothetical protein H257_05848 [Aphanomyces astaci]